MYIVRKGKGQSFVFILKMFQQKLKPWDSRDYNIIERAVAGQGLHIGLRGGGKTVDHIGIKYPFVGSVCFQSKTDQVLKSINFVFSELKFLF